MKSRGLKETKHPDSALIFFSSTTLKVKDLNIARFYHFTLGRLHGPNENFVT